MPKAGLHGLIEATAGESGGAAELAFDIVLQFLTEAVVLASLRGLLRMGLGWSIAFIARTIFPLSAEVPLWAAAAGVDVSVGAGLGWRRCGTNRRSY